MALIAEQPRTATTQHCGKDALAKVAPLAVITRELPAMTPKNLLLLAFSGIVLAHCVSTQHSTADKSRPVDPPRTQTTKATEPINAPTDMSSSAQPLPPSANEPYLPPPAAIWSNNGSSGFDTWRVMNEHMTFAPDATGPFVDLEVQKYRDNPRIVAAAAERASLYLPYVTRRLMESDLPPELALLPFMESAYNPHAISPNGAAGLWQIQPGTGDVLGLKRDQWYDGRQDIVRSTDAVIGYFGHLHQVFGGDWLLALAAFNSGEGTVSKAIQRNLDQGKDTDFWALDLPEHTRSYIPQFLALARMFQNPEESQLRLPLLDQGKSLASVTTPKQISLARAAELAEVDYDTLKRLNTGLKRGVTPPQSRYEILLPSNAAQRFEAALLKSPSTQTLPASSQYQTVKASRVNTSAAKVQSADYRVQSGDSLWTIARRFGVNPKTLMRWNNIDNPRALRPGQNLQIIEH
ncbi:MAG: transglycosylase SLT domain-containing protein [Porticoccaceae bacterium]